MIDDGPCILPQKRRNKISKADKLLERAKGPQQVEVVQANAALVAAREIQDNIRGQVAQDMADAKKVVEAAVEEAGELLRKGEAVAGHIMSTTMQTGNASVRVEELLKKHGAEPAEELIKLAQMTLADGTFVLTTDQRISIWSKMMEYRHPKLRAQEVRSTIDQSLTVVVRKFENQKVLKQTPVIDVGVKKTAIQEDSKAA